jgi:hypothetical protein
MPAFAQAPTQAQQQAIRSNCVSDYRAHCSGVPTGGMDALICLEKNVDSLSPGCKTAVEAVEPASSSPTPETAAQPSESASAPAAESSGGSGASAPDASVAAAEGSSAGTSAPSTGAATSPAARPKLTFRQEMAVAGGSCAVDFRLFCPNLPVGHGNVLFCLQVHWHKLAPRCRDALTKLGAAPSS